MRTEFGAETSPDTLADLKQQTEILERKLTDARAALERELGAAGWEQPDPAGAWVPEPRQPEPDYATGPIVVHGRRNARRTHVRLPRLPHIPAGAKAVALVMVTLLAVFVVLAQFSGSATWPVGVGYVQSQVVQACKNPDVASEPGQVNFACGKDSQQILWVFALLTSGNQPGYADVSTGRRGLEPIAPAQGGEVAWSLNLHHPYNPASPGDSIVVAARAINNIIGGATITSSTGAPVVQPGLEGSAANCQRYTGSPVLRTRPGYPPLCAGRLTQVGEADLVGDVFLRWVPGSTSQQAMNAVVLFEHPADPGNAQVQAILAHLPKP